ncbi:MAG: preprotein translocase subunit SecG [Bacteroidales bacterium]|nr:preprotein translocase subunit SecG [Bacteroidales bacterium]
MSALFTILAVLALVGSVLITLIVLLQNGKGGGLASNFAAGNQTFGVRQTTDLLEKITWGLAIFILVVSIAASFSYGKKSSSLTDRANQDLQPVEVAAEPTEEVEAIEIDAPSESVDAVEEN